jgi:peptidoglycan/LPS O-acetylase OafA/YrhL
MAIAFNPALDRLELSRRLARSLYTIAALALIGTLVVRDPAFRETFRYTIQALAAAVLIFAAVRTHRGRFGRALAHPMMVRVGVLSYAIYLIHLIAIEALQRTSLPTPVVVVLALSISLLGAHLLHRAIEQPALQFRKALLAKRARQKEFRA